MSQLGELRRDAAEARTAYSQARIAADTASNSQTYFAFAVEQWKLSHTGEDREPLPIIQGNARYDVAMRPPPTDEQVVALEKAAAAAERKLNKARRALEDAAALGPPKRKPSTTGWVATKNFRFLGESFSVGDEFDPGIAAPEKFSRLIGSRMVAPTSPAGADHA